MKIGENTITEITSQVEGLTRSYQLNINDAFRKSGGQDFSITYTCKMSPDTHGIKVVTEIKFRPEPDVKDRASGVVDDDQLDLFPDAPKRKLVYPILRPWPKGSNPPRFKPVWQ